MCPGASIVDCASQRLYVKDYVLDYDNVKSDQVVSCEWDVYQCRMVSVKQFVYII